MEQLIVGIIKPIETTLILLLKSLGNRKETLNLLLVFQRRHKVIHLYDQNSTNIIIRMDVTNILYICDAFSSLFSLSELVTEFWDGH